MDTIKLINKGDCKMIAHRGVSKLERENKGLRYRIFGAIQRGEIDGFKVIGKMQGMKSYSDDGEEK